MHGTQSHRRVNAQRGRPTAIMLVRPPAKTYPRSCDHSDPMSPPSGRSMSDPLASGAGSSPSVAAPLPQASGREPCAVGLVVEVGSPPWCWLDDVGHVVGDAEVEVEVGRAAQAPGRAEEGADAVGQAGDVVVAAALEVEPLATGGAAEAAGATGGEIGATGVSGTASTPRA